MHTSQHLTTHNTQHRAIHQHVSAVDSSNDEPVGTTAPQECNDLQHRDAHLVELGRGA